MTRKRKHLALWQPIETAPRDGSQVLISDGKDIALVWWEYERWMIYTHQGLCVFKRFYETYWMPLPKPPAPSTSWTEEDEQYFTETFGAMDDSRGYLTNKDRKEL